MEETKVGYLKSGQSIETPDVAAPATEYAIRDLLRTPEFKKKSNDANEQTIRDIAKELHRDLTNGTLSAKILTLFKGEERKESKSEGEILNSILGKLNAMVLEKDG